MKLEILQKLHFTNIRLDRCIYSEVARICEALQCFYKEECIKEGALSQREKQLIALGISLYTQDEYCIIYHTKGCLDQGCSEQEILEAVGVTAAFGGGAAMSQAVTLVQECIEDLNQLKQ